LRQRGITRLATLAGGALTFGSVHAWADAMHSPGQTSHGE
jgi:hypothetical protein